MAKSSDMDREKFYRTVQSSVMAAVLVLVIYGSARSFQNRPAVSHYLAAREAIRARGQIPGISRFAGPSEIRTERINDSSTNIWGWVMSTNRGQVRTQWFRCVIQNGKFNTPYISDIEVFRSDPSSSNSVSSLR
jgi:hypothetical protein